MVKRKNKKKGILAIIYSNIYHGCWSSDDLSKLTLVSGRAKDENLGSDFSSLGHSTSLLYLLNYSLLCVFDIIFFIFVQPYNTNLAEAFFQA